MRYLIILSLLLVGCAKDGDDGRNGNDFTPPVVNDPDIPPDDGEEEELPPSPEEPTLQCTLIKKNKHEWTCCLIESQVKCKRTHVHNEEDEHDSH